MEWSKKRTKPPQTTRIITHVWYVYMVHKSKTLTDWIYLVNLFVIYVLFFHFFFFIIDGSFVAWLYFGVIHVEVSNLLIHQWERECVCVCSSVCARRKIAGIGACTAQQHTNHDNIHHSVLNAHFSIVFSSVGNFRRCYTLPLPVMMMVFYEPRCCSLPCSSVICNCPKASAQLGHKKGASLHYNCILPFIWLPQVRLSRTSRLFIICIICVLSFRFEWSR